MALPFGPLLLITVVGAAVFAGLDPRKKKKNGESSGGAPPPQPDQAEVVSCAHVIDFSGDGQKAAIDGGSWQPTPSFEPEYWAIEHQRPQVLFTLCGADPTSVAMLEQLCQQNPDIDFYGVYLSRLTGMLQQQMAMKCQKEGYVVGFNVYAPTSEESSRAYVGDLIPELLIHAGDNVVNALATVLAFSQGADHPAAQDYFTE